MSAWIGPLGGLVEVLHYKGGLSVSQERAQSTRMTLGGRVKVQRGPRVRREWPASTPYASASEAASFLALLEAGTPPWVWVDPYAQVTNMFTPEQSTLAPGSWFSDGSTAGGAVTMDGLYAPRSVTRSAPGLIHFGFRDGSSDRPPVVPGVPVSVSAYVRGAGGMGVSWRDWQGDVLSSESSNYNNGSMARVSMVNLVPPLGAVSASFWVDGARQAAMPCLTWTPDAPRWSMGRGCTRAIVESLSEAPEQGDLLDPQRRYSALKFTVREVG